MKTVDLERSHDYKVVDLLSAFGLVHIVDRSYKTNRLQYGSFVMHTKSPSLGN